MLKKARSWISRILRTSQWPPPADDDFWYNIPGQDTAAGVKINEETALKFLTVSACVGLVAGDVAQLPLVLYRKDAQGTKQVVTDHPLAEVFKTAVTPEISKFNFLETGQSHLMLWGNHYAFKVPGDMTGKPVGLIPIASPASITPHFNDQGGISYEYTPKAGKRTIKTREEIFHVPGWGFNGLIGKSPITMAREAIGLGVASQNFGSKYFGTGIHPTGVVEMEADLGENRDEYLKALRKQYAGLGKAHSIMLLEFGMQYKPMSMSNEDAQFIETRKHQATEICGFYRVPPHKVAIHGANSNYSNLEQENASYVNTTLMPWLRRWEAAINLQMLTREERGQGLFFEFKVAGLLRGDSVARGAFYRELFNLAALSPNEIRGLENMNPVPGGDQRFVALNMIPLDQAGEGQDDGGDGSNRGRIISVSADSPLLLPLEDTDLGAVEGRSIQHRDRIAKRYRPLIHDTAQRLVSLEANAIRRKLSARSKREWTDFIMWLDEFYREQLPAKIKRAFGPVFTSFANSILDASQEETGISEPPDDEFQKWSDSYIDYYVDRHIGSSTGQLKELLAEEEPAEAIESRLDEWTEKRADKITSNETVRGASAVFAAVALAGGLRMIWRIRGTSTCPYCKRLNGKVVGRNETFANDGDEITDEKDQLLKMKVRGVKKHPPLHRGCDCYIEAVS